MATSPKTEEEILETEKSVNVDIKKTDITAAMDTSQPQLGEIAIEASEIVSRLEQVAEGVPIPENTFNQSTVFLGLEKKHTNEIIHVIRSLISVDDDGEPITFPALDSVTKLVMVSHSLAAYCGVLERPILQKLSTRFTTDTTRWISQLYGFLDSSAFYHEDHLEGLVRVTRMMLHYKYPRYLEDGALAFTNSLPTIYSSIASPLGVVQHLCRQLGLPLACIRPIPVNTHFGSQYTMDLSALQKMLADDVATGRTPLIVIADAGTPITGHIDNISRIRELCKVHGVWLHLRGHSLAALALPNHQRNGHIPPVADSFTLMLGSWLGIPGLPMITLYRLWDSTLNSNRGKQVGASRESTLPLLAGLNTDHQGRRILALPLWAALQSLGKEGVHTRIREDFLASEKLWAALDCFRHVRVLSPKPGGESGTYPVSELISKPVSIPLLFESTASCVVFQFTPEVNEGEFLSKVPPYYDKLNSWLGQILQIDAPQVPIDICELENVGVVLRFCPFENVSGQQPTLLETQAFVQCLEQQLIILRSTIHHKETFIKLVEASPVLKLVDLPDWAGMGGVRYCPEGWEQLLTDQAKDELNQLNIALVDSLRSTDSAFSLGEDVDGLMCVRFGMLTPQSDVEDLLNLIVRVGQSVEENSRVLDSMSEIVRKAKMLIRIVVLLLLNITYSQQYYQIEDIPIENFEHGNIGDDAFDFELMPRSSRSLFKDEPIVENIKISRPKRSTLGKESSDNEKSVANLVIGLGKPLEVSVIEPENITEKAVELTKSPRSLDNHVSINDFLRFRRSTEQNSMTETLKQSMDPMKNNENRNFTNPDNLYKKDVETFDQFQKFVVAPNDSAKESAREARGITKEQWVRQPYPVRNTDDIFEDNSQSSSDSVRAPRVHFVTQTREPEYKYDREARSRSLNREISRNLARDMSAEMDNYQPRYMRPWRYENRGDFDFNNNPSRNYRDPYYYDRMNDYPDRTRNSYEDIRRPERKQKRIIYYATLPDISRSPSNMDKRERYDYRDRYDDRYYSPDPYRYRYKGYMKPRYEENAVRGDKSPYPQKVSTDLSVREVKKNPERRYSEVDRSRYAPNVPYQSDRM